MFIWVFAWISLPRSFEEFVDARLHFARRLTFLLTRTEGRAGAEEQDRCPSSPESACMVFRMLSKYSPKNRAFIWSGRIPFLFAVYK